MSCWGWYERVSGKFIIDSRGTFGDANHLHRHELFVDGVDDSIIIDTDSKVAG